MNQQQTWFKKPLKRVYLDIDGVLADFEWHFLTYLDLPLYSPTDWQDFRFRDEFYRVKGDEKFWSTIPTLVKPEELIYPIEGYCTSRPIANDITEQWLRSNFFPKGDLINVETSGSTKSSLLRDVCDVFVDDGIYNFIDCHNNGVECYLMTRPHNKKYDVGEYRVNSLKEFFEKIKSI